MKELKKFNVLSVGKVFGLFGLVVSILQMIFLKLVSMNATVALQYGLDASQLTFKLVILGIISATFVYFISGLVMALIYNLIVRYSGGVQFELTEAEVKVKAKKKKKK